jgi:hypothetical protein
VRNPQEPSLGFDTDRNHTIFGAQIGTVRGFSTLKTLTRVSGLADLVEEVVRPGDSQFFFFYLINEGDAIYAPTFL